MMNTDHDIFNKKHCILVLVLLVTSSVFSADFVDSIAMPTTPSTGLSAAEAAATKKEIAKNTTLLLDQLLEGYDRRLRPGFGCE